MIRQTWANSTAFNYPQFARLHGHLKDQYLPINHPELKKFVRKDNEHVIIVSKKFAFLFSFQKKIAPNDNLVW